MTMAQNDFVDILDAFLINKDPWYIKLLNINKTADSLDDARKALKNVSFISSPPLSFHCKLTKFRYQWNVSSKRVGLIRNPFPAPPPLHTPFLNKKVSKK